MFIKPELRNEWTSKSWSPFERSRSKCPQTRNLRISVGSRAFLNGFNNPQVANVLKIRNYLEHQRNMENSDSFLVINDNTVRINWFFLFRRFFGACTEALSFFYFTINKGITFCSLFNLKLHDIGFGRACGKLFLKHTLNRIWPRNRLIEFKKKKLVLFIVVHGFYCLSRLLYNIFVCMIFHIDNICQLFSLCMWLAITQKIAVKTFLLWKLYQKLHRKRWVRFLNSI